MWIDVRFTRLWFCWFARYVFAASIGANPVSLSGMLLFWLDSFTLFMCFIACKIAYNWASSTPVSSGRWNTWCWSLAMICSLSWSRHDYDIMPQFIADRSIPCLHEPSERAEGPPGGELAPSYSEYHARLLLKPRSLARRDSTQQNCFIELSRVGRYDHF